MGMPNRVNLSMLLLIVSSAVLGAGAVYWQERNTSRIIESKTLESIRSVQRVSEALKRSELELKTGILASNPSFVGYVSQALAAGQEAGGVIDAVSIRDLLDERRRQYSLDFAGIIDPRGNSVVMLGSVMQTFQDISKSPLLARVRAGSTPATSLWCQGDHLVLVTLAPLLRGDTVEAFLLTGVDINRDFVDPLAGSSHADVALIGFAPSGNTVVASTLGASLHPALLEAVATGTLSAKKEESDDAPSLLEVDLGEGNTTASAVFLFDSPDAGVMVSIIPASQRVLARKAIREPAMAAAAALLVVIALIWWLIQRRLMRPLGRLSEMSERILRNDFHVIAREDGDAGVAIVGRALNHSLASLRGYKEAMESQSRKP